MIFVKQSKEVRGPGFLYQMLTEHLLCARYCARSRRDSKYIKGEGNLSFQSLHCVYILLKETMNTQVNE